MTKTNTLKDIAAERHHNSTDNRSGVIARLYFLIEGSHLLHLLSSRFV
jgi:hypothetical protein